MDTRLFRNNHPLFYRGSPRYYNASLEHFPIQNQTLLNWRIRIKISIQRMTDLIILVKNNLLIITVLDEQMTVVITTSGYDNNNDERQLMSELISQGI